MPKDDQRPQRCIGLAIREVRHRRGFTQEDLAYRAGLHPTYICDIERGARNPSWKAVDMLLTGLGCPLEEFGVVYDRIRLNPDPPD